MNPTQSPLIVIGMHRSGTSLVTRLLEDMGLFVGWRKDVNHEAWFFLRLNEWLIRQSGGAWDQPRAIHHLTGNEIGREAVAAYLESILSSPQALSYLGPRRYFRYRGVGALEGPWGWKDPRNTFTLPVWLDLFPRARVIHVYRHGVDVAASLHQRQLHSTHQARRKAARSAARYGLMPRWGGLVDSWRCADLDDAVSLWSEYIREARSHVSALGRRAMELRYEDLLEHPQTALGALARFCGLTAEAAGRAAEGIRASRALAYRKDPSLRRLAVRWADELRAFGY